MRELPLTCNCDQINVMAGFTWIEWLPCGMVSHCACGCPICWIRSILNVTVNVYPLLAIQFKTCD